MDVKPHSFLTSAPESKWEVHPVRGKVYFYQATENESLHSKNQLQEYDFKVQNFINRDGLYTVQYQKKTGTRSLYNTIHDEIL
jgi:hypothetical protein